MLYPLAKRRIVGVGNRVPLTQANRLTVVKVPFLDSPIPQEIAVIGEKFFQAGSGNAGELETRSLLSLESLRSFD
jgi:hypothetical protein